MKEKQIDKTLLGLVIVFMAGGFLVFSSASLGLLAREGAQFSSVAFNQLIFGLLGGSIMMFITSQIHYRYWRKFAFYIFFIACVLTLLVFVPGLGFSHGGAQRWLIIGGFSIQPAEFLKIAYVIYVATILSGIHKQLHNFKHGILPFLLVTGCVGIIMLLQPNTDTFALMVVSGLAMFVSAGGRWRDLFLMIFLGIILLAILAFSRSYIMDRLTTFIDPSVDPQGKSYQLNQSLIAIGAGGLTGRGYGQSIQKFHHLPEPIGDSVFSVFAEEFGFAGSFIMLALFSFFTLRGYHIATHAPDLFSLLLVVGIITMITFQALLNISAMIGIAPLMGLPLPFISHGGTALLTTLASVGIVLNVSKYQRR